MLGKFRLHATCLIVILLPQAAMADKPPLMGVRQIVAHRGSSSDRPECTLASIRRAIEAGATAVEVDVRRTKDGQLVILHDATLDRTTNGNGPLSEKTLAEVRELDAGSWFDSKYAGERVPTLSEVMKTCRADIDVLLDLKEQGAEFAEAVVAEVKQYGSPRRTICWRPERRTGQAIPEFAAAGSATRIDPESRCDRALCRAWGGDHSPLAEMGGRRPIACSPCEENRGCTASQRYLRSARRSGVALEALADVAL